jgi:hypothetical protein
MREETKKAQQSCGPLGKRLEEVAALWKLKLANVEEVVPCAIFIAILAPSSRSIEGEEGKIVLPSSYFRFGNVGKISDKVRSAAYDSWKELSQSQPISEYPDEEQEILARWMAGESCLSAVIACTGHCDIHSIRPPDFQSSPVAFYRNEKAMSDLLILAFAEKHSVTNVAYRGVASETTLKANSSFKRGSTMASGDSTSSTAQPKSAGSWISRCTTM